MYNAGNGWLLFMLNSTPMLSLQIPADKVLPVLNSPTQVSLLGVGTTPTHSVLPLALNSLAL